MFTKFLEVFVDERLSWREHADYVRGKIHKSTGIIRRVRHLVTTECILTLYYSLIYPYLSYSYTLQKKKNCILQKCFVRIATRSNAYTSSVPLFQKLQVLSLLFMISIFLKYVLLFLRYIQVKKRPRAI